MPVQYRGLQGCARAWALSQICQTAEIVTTFCSSQKSAEHLVDEVRFFLPDLPIHLIPAWDSLAFEAVSPQVFTTAQRIGAVMELSQKTPGLYLIPAPSALTRFPHPEHLITCSFELRTGLQIQRDEMVQRLEYAGYRRASLVEEKGEYAVRGSVVDVFPGTSRSPLRVDFFDDVIESLRLFDAASQRTIRPTDLFFIRPVREQFHLPTLLESRSGMQTALTKVKERGREKEVPPRELARIMNALREGSDFPGVELVQSVALSPLPDIFQFLSLQSTHIVIEDEVEFSLALSAAWDLICEREARFEGEQIFIPSKETLYVSPDFFRKQLTAFPLDSLDSLDVLEADQHSDQTVQRVRTRSNTELAQRLKSAVGSGAALQPLVQQILNWRDENYSIALVAGSTGRAQRLYRLLLDQNLLAELDPNLGGLAWSQQASRKPLVILSGHLHSGVLIEDEKLAFISEVEVFGERSYRTGPDSSKNLKRLLASLSHLKENDFIVHIDYGIGIYRGLQHRELEGVVNDLIVIEYEDSTLYVPVHDIGKIQRFVGAEGKQPALDKLSSTRWKKTRAKVRRTVMTLAGDLIKLYASRRVARGWRFEPIGAEDERFADNFPHNETPDQLAAIEDTLNDMAASEPMDRLICGDVGFGKTEVALRAAYKCLQHARQVTILAPTTILVEQHLQTFRKRFADYPVQIDAVSRFYSSARNREVLDQMQSGKLDVIIGTHRLLQKDVQFRDLGLLIIDEEHRFGVKQKEYLKQLRKEVDVLTLTATPIPRTLHMSLLDIRDVSLISTPPQDRRAIRTYTATHSPALIRDSILRELQREGQSFYVHNRVQGLELITSELRELVPEARFECAHGQMSERQLEEIMYRFLQHEVDVLVCTTIIESGIDISNCNTMIIDRADRFGLAQLYQLRGRVGRASRQAYCYFLVPPERRLKGEAAQRLKVLQSLDDLGQGFTLAIRDLEIRGAGNLLGKEQSGSVMAVGFELYTKILKEAITHLKSGKELQSDLPEPELNIELSAYIPEVYVPDVSERLILYQRLAAIEGASEALSLEEEISDRFGPLPREVDHLLQLMYLRALLRQFGITRADITPLKITLSFVESSAVNADEIIRLVKTDPERYRFSKSYSLTVREKVDLEDPRAITGNISKLLRRVAAPLAGQKAEEMSVL